MSAADSINYSTLKLLQQLAISKLHMLQTRLHVQLAFILPSWQQPQKPILIYSSLRPDFLEPCLLCFLCLWCRRGLSRGRTFLCMWWTCSLLLCLNIPLVSCFLASSPFTINLWFSSSSSCISPLTWLASDSDETKNNKITFRVIFLLSLFQNKNTPNSQNKIITKTGKWEQLEWEAYHSSISWSHKAVLQSSQSNTILIFYRKTEYLLNFFVVGALVKLNKNVITVKL